MASSLYKRTALGEDKDLTIPTSSPRYKLGEIIQLVDSEAANPEVIAEFIYIKNVQEININRSSVIVETIEVEAEVSLSEAGSAQTAPIALVAIPQITIPSEFYGFAQIKGNAIAVTNGNPSAISIGDPLHVGFGLADVLQGGSIASQTVALALEALASGTNTEFPVLMLGNLVAISA